MRGITCERCGVEVQPASVRKERLGHIELAAPVINPLFTTPETLRVLGAVVGLSAEGVWQLLFAHSLLVEQGDKPPELELAVPLEPVEPAAQPPGVTRERVREMLSRRLVASVEWDEVSHSEHAVGVATCTGPRAVSRLLEETDPLTLAPALAAEIDRAPMGSRRREWAEERLAVLTALCDARVSPSDLAITALPVLPAGLRPILTLGGGRTLSHDLNDLYRLVIHRNHRLERLVSEDVSPVLVEAAVAGLQDAVEMLFVRGAETPKHTTSRDHTEPLLVALDRHAFGALGGTLDFSAQAPCLVDESLAVGRCVIPHLVARRLFEPQAARVASDIVGGTVSPAHAVRLLETHREVAMAAVQIAAIGSSLMIWDSNLQPARFVGLQIEDVAGETVRVSPLDSLALGFAGGSGRISISVPLSPEAESETLVLMRAGGDAPGRDPLIDVCLRYGRVLEIREASPMRAFSSSAEVLRALDAGFVEPLQKVLVRMDIRTVATPARLVLAELLGNCPVPLDLAVRSVDALVSAARAVGEDCACRLPWALARTACECSLDFDAGETSSDRFASIAPVRWVSSAARSRTNSALRLSLDAFSQRLVRDLFRAAAPAVGPGLNGVVVPRGADWVYRFATDLRGSLEEAAGATAQALRDWADGAAMLTGLLWREKAADVLDECGGFAEAPAPAIVAPFAGVVTLLESADGRVLMLNSGYLDEKTWELAACDRLVPGVAVGCHVSAGAALTLGYVDTNLVARAADPATAERSIRDTLGTILKQMGLPNAQPHVVEFTDLLLRGAGEANASRYGHVAAELYPTLDEVVTVWTSERSGSPDVAALLQAILARASVLGSTPGESALLAGGLPAVGTGSRAAADFVLRGPGHPAIQDYLQALTDAAAAAATSISPEDGIFELYSDLSGISREEFTLPPESDSLSVDTVEANDSNDTEVPDSVAPELYGGAATAGDEPFSGEFMAAEAFNPIPSFEQEAASVDVYSSPTDDPEELYDEVVEWSDDICDSDADGAGPASKPKPTYPTQARWAAVDRRGEPIPTLNVTSAPKAPKGEIKWPG